MKNKLLLCLTVLGAAWTLTLRQSALLPSLGKLITRGKTPTLRTVKATFHLTIFDIPMRPMREDQRYRRRFTR